jgi:hypothetical protein
VGTAVDSEPESGSYKHFYYGDTGKALYVVVDESTAKTRLNA